MKADMLKRIRSDCSDFPERKNELLQGISDNSLKYPSHIDDLIEEWRAQANAEQKAAEEALARAAALAAAETNEQEKTTTSQLSRLNLMLEINPKTLLRDAHRLAHGMNRNLAKNKFGEVVGNHEKHACLI